MLTKRHKATSSPTLGDIARNLNLSVSTVSYALNGGPRSVSTEVRDRVLAAAAELNYRPNFQAKSLVTGRTHSIGVILPRLERDAILSPFVHLATNGIVNTAEDLRQDVVLLTATDASSTVGDDYELPRSRIDGVVLIAPPTTSRLPQYLADRDIPYAVVASSWRASGVSVEADNVQGVHLALDHLASLGHRRIAMICGRQLASDAITREHAFVDYMNANGLDVPCDYLQPGDFTVETGSSAMRNLLACKKRPTAVFCANDLTALGALDEARRQGVDVPGEISVVGFDNIPHCQSYFPPLTTVHQPVEEMASAAVRLVVGLVEGRDPCCTQVFDTALVVRQSTGPAPE